MGKSMPLNVKNNPVVRVAQAVNSRYGADSGGYLAAAITYYSFFSLFPLMLIALSVIGFVFAGNDQAQKEWVARLSASIPGLSGLIGENIQALVEARGALGLVGLVGALWTGTGIVGAAGHALSRIFRVPEYTGFLRKRAWSVSTTVGLGLVALVGLGLAGLAGAIKMGGFAGVAVRLAGAIVAFGLDFALFLLAYRLLTEPEGPRFGDLWKGALFAAAGWTILKLVGGWYVTRTVATSTALYGSFASAIAVLVLLYLASRFFLYGAELNAVLIEEKGGRVMPKEERPEFPLGDGSQQKPIDEQSTFELLRSITSDTVALVRKEVELARQEILEAVSARLKAAAAFAAAGFLAVLAIVFLGLAAAAALDLVVAAWISRLIVAAVFLVLVGAGVGFGILRMKQPPLAPEKTKGMVKEDVEWAKAQLKR